MSSQNGFGDLFISEQIETMTNFVLMIISLENSSNKILFSTFSTYIWDNAELKGLIFT
jgi:hypothetical protein